MRSHRLRWGLVAAVACFLASCGTTPPQSSSSPTASGKPGELPGFAGDGRNTSYPALPRLYTLAAPLPASVLRDPASLNAILTTQRKVASNAKAVGSAALDGLPHPYTSQDAQQVLNALQRWAQSNRPLSEFVQGYQLRGDGQGNVRFTSYYTPSLAVSDRQSTAYPVPIYKMPPQSGGQLPSRAEISRGALAGKGLEVAWTNSLMDLYFLQVQGSGYGVYPNGQRRLLSYNGKNGQSYVSIGRKLVEQGEIPVEQVSMQSIRAWMSAHPDRAEGVMNLNPSYTFLTFGPNAVTGSAGVELTPLASAATDPTVIPPGSMVVIEMPVLNSAGQLDHYQPRLLAVQDRGGAIKGSDRLDIYAGSGPQAEMMAGTLKHFGRLWLLLPK